MERDFPTLITFDCASTLVDVVAREADLFALAAEDLGFEVTSNHVRQFQTYWDNWSEYVTAVHSGDTVACDEYWIRKIDTILGESTGSKIFRRSQELALSKPSRAFGTYPDVVPCLNRLTTEVRRLGVISNWDHTLDACLAVTDLTDYFEFTIASLVFGHEKPDARIFEQALKIAHCSASEVIHIGDDPVDDIEGARNVGIRSILLRRPEAALAPPKEQPYKEGDIVVIESLDSLEAAIEWIS